MPASDSSSPAPLHHRRGGQPGNANHLKHGLYARPKLPFTSREPASVPVTDLQAEIDLYREYIRTYAEASLGSGTGDQESARRSLLALAYASNQLAALVRIQAHARLFTSTSREFQTWLASLPGPGEADE